MTQIYIESTIVGNRACLDVLESGLSIRLVNTVPCALVVECYDTNHTCKNLDEWMVNYDCENTELVNLRTIDIRICDVYGNVLPLPSNQHIGLVFKVYEPD